MKTLFAVAALMFAGPAARADGLPQAALSSADPLARQIMSKYGGVTAAVGVKGLKQGIALDLAPDASAPAALAPAAKSPDEGLKTAAALTPKRAAKAKKDPRKAARRAKEQLRAVSKGASSF